MTSRRVLIRVDAGLGMGMGHLMRCLALATQLVSRGAKVTIACRGNSLDLLNRVHSSGAKLIQLPEGNSEDTADGPVWSHRTQIADAECVLAASPMDDWDVVVVDHYKLDARWEGVLRKRSSRLIVIDDLADRPHDADGLVDHNWYGRGNASRYDALVPKRTQLLLGPRFALLHPEYAATHSRAEGVIFPPRRVLVSFGGTDVSGQTAKAVRALQQFPGLCIDAVVGTARAVSVELELLSDHHTTNLHVGLPNLVGLLSSADLVIGAGGTATWERLFMQVPSLVTTVSENQSGVTRALAEAGMTLWLGTSHNVGGEDYENAIRKYMRTGPPEIPAIVDGHGAARVAMFVLPPEISELRTRPAEARDLASAVTAGHSAQLADDLPSIWRENTRLFQGGLRTGERMVVVEANGVPVGFGRPSQPLVLDAYVEHLREGISE